MLYAERHTGPNRLWNLTKATRLFLCRLTCKHRNKKRCSPPPFSLLSRLLRRNSCAKSDTLSKGNQQNMPLKTTTTILKNGNDGPISGVVGASKYLRNKRDKKRKKNNTSYATNHNNIEMNQSVQERILQSKYNLFYYFRQFRLYFDWSILSFLV